MTFPPCEGNVTWYVFTEPAIISQYLSTYLYSLHSGSHDATLGMFTIKGNNRPASKHYVNRTVLRSFVMNDHVIRMKQNTELFDRMMQSLFVHNKIRNFQSRSHPGDSESKSVTNLATSRELKEDLDHNRRLEQQFDSLSHSSFANKSLSLNHSTLKNKPSYTLYVTPSVLVVFLPQLLETI